MGIQDWDVHLSTLVLVNNNKHLEAESYKGLVSVEINPGDREVELYYNPFIK